MSRNFVTSIAAILTLTAAFSVSGLAQAPTTPPKVVIVNTMAFFDEKTGITRIVTAAKALNSELEPKKNDVRGYLTRIDTLTKEVEAFRANVAKGVPIDQNAAQAKLDQLESLKREGKYREDDYNAFAQKRQNEVVGPVYAEVIRSLSEYIKSKGYGMVFDVSKDESGMLIFASEQHDITKEFIAYYNARPPTAINSVPN